MLLTAGGLFYRSVGALDGLDIGFDPAGRYVASFDFERDGINGDEEAHRLQGVLLEQVSQIPGVEGVTLATDLPLDLRSQSIGVVPEGSRGAGRGEAALAHSSFVGSDYFDVLETTVLAGRGIEARDGPDTPGVAVVNQVFVNRFWPGEVALGRSFLVGRDETRFTVVGIAEEVKTSIYLDQPVPKVYLPMSQRPVAPFHLVVKSELPLSELAPELFSVITSVHPEISGSAPGTLAGRISFASLPQQIGARLIGGLALVALLLSGLGLYGVIASSVVQQTREIGIRLVLGASRRSVVTRVIAQVGWVVLPAALIGGGGAFFVRGVIAAFLVGVEPSDPVTVIGVVVLLGVVAFVACAIPAARAARLEPGCALRVE